jgi:hypothetical protein
MTDPRKRDDWAAHIRWCQAELDKLFEQLSYTSESTELSRDGEDIKCRCMAPEIARLEETIEFARSQIN